MDHPRLPYARLARPAYQAMIQLNAYLNASSVERGLIELLNYRISQLNGCAYCLDLHGTWLREHGEDPRRLDGLPAWREAPWFTDRERAALAWAEDLTEGPEGAGAAFEALQAQFTEAEVVDLTFAIAVMNAWNRLAIGFRTPPQR